MKISDLLKVFLTCIGTYKVGADTFICSEDRIQRFQFGVWEPCVITDNSYSRLSEDFCALVYSHFVMNSRVTFVCKKVVDNLKGLYGFHCEDINGHICLFRQVDDSQFLVIMPKSGGVFYYTNKKTYTLYEVLKGISDIDTDFLQCHEGEMFKLLFEELSQDKTVKLTTNTDFRGFPECSFHYAGEDGCIECSNTKGACNVGVMLGDGRISKDYWLSFLRFYSEVVVMEEFRSELNSLMEEFCSKLNCRNRKDTLQAMALAMELAGTDTASLRNVLKVCSK